MYCADCGQPIEGEPIYWMGTSARCIPCHTERMGGKIPMEDLTKEIAEYRQKIFDRMMETLVAETNRHVEERKRLGYTTPDDATIAKSIDAQRKYYEKQFSLDADWKREILAKVPKMSNEDLFESFVSLSGGDDYDGCFTEKGDFEYKVLDFELCRRLRDVGFLPQTYVYTR